MDFKCDELILGKKDADSRALTQDIAAYQLLGFAMAAAVIWLGVRREWPDVVNTGLTFFVIFFYTKLFDWWWQSMPKYLFFLLLGLSAVLILLILRRLRSANGLLGGHAQ